ncbi:MAG: hypothetical protein CSYNP_00723 [Syntrophus sp. SKADARSKE-3]|nr:hypothetical protein [Syntrophus sp. SKADARSKE-3]
MCDNVPDMIWAKDRSKRYLFANKATCEKLLNAMDTEEPIGKLDMYFAERERNAHPARPDWHTFGEICADSDDVVMSSTQSGRFDEYGNVKGQFLFLDVHKAPFFDEHGNIIGTVGCGRDVTREKQLEIERRETEEKYRSLFENAVEGIFQTTIDGHFLNANPALAHKLGYESPEDLMTSVTDIGSQLYARPEEREEFIRLIKEKGKLKNFEGKARRKDGSEMYASINVRLVCDNAGWPLYYEGFLMDITVRKQVEEFLKEREKTFATAFLMNSIPAAITTLKEGRYIEVSEAFLKLMGLELHQVIGNTSTGIGFITPEQREIFLNEFIRKGFVENLELEMRTKGGEIRHGLFNSVKIPISHEDHLLTLVTDITERKHTELELARYKEGLEQLVSERTLELENKSQILEELNVALKVLLQQRDEDKTDLEKRVVMNVKNLVIPFIERIKSSHLDERQLAYLNVIEMNINDITSSMMKKMRHYNFTSTEVEVASLIKEGKSTKDIVDIIGIAASSVHTHRNNIRKKLGISKKNVNLQSHLQSLD